MSFYFEKFEDRVPEPPLAHNEGRELLWQFLAVMAIVIGAWYLFWRWTSSLNLDALWYSIPLVVAETGAYFGLILFVFNLWKVKDTPKQAPPTLLSEVVSYAPQQDRPINVDIYFPTFDEEAELVKFSIVDAKKINNPMNVNINIYVLDDGRRPEMEQLAKDEGVHYITRDNNIGFKAGNLRNAMEQTGGDFIVICDADTRPFPTILENTLGYFKDTDVAWVQTPQWFFDLPEGKTLDKALEKYLSKPGRYIGKGIQKVFGEIKIGEDPFVNDPKMFYDVIQRRRNWCNASICCGAGSIHRREAVMEAALKSYADQLDTDVENISKKVKKLTGEKEIDPRVLELMNQQAFLDNEFTPYKFHVSEDVYTSIVLHSDSDRNWKSVLHPDVESKMLSPQDLLSWTIQRFKYAGGTLDIAKNDNPLFRKGMSIEKRLMYFSTAWSYLGGIWNLIFLIAPLIYLFFAIAPVTSYSMEFYIHIIPFLVFTELAFMVGGWGLAGYPSKACYIAFFPTNLRALWTVIKGENIKFPVTPKDRQEGNFLHLAMPQIMFIVLTISAVVYAWLQFQLENPAYSINGVLLNSFWAINNIIALSSIIVAALWKPETEPKSEALT